jgi:hypothetical protein
MPPVRSGSRWATLIAMSNERKCGDCGHPIGDDDDVVRVGEDWFHAACYMPPSLLSEARDRARALGDGDPRG